MEVTIGSRKDSKLVISKLSNKSSVQHRADWVRIANLSHNSNRNSLHEEMPPSGQCQRQNHY